MIAPAVLVGIGGAIGAVLRYGVGQAFAGEQVPYSTFTVNVLGTFVLGLVVFGGASDSAVAAIGIGACGAFTTFSSFSVDTVRLWEDDNRTIAAVYAVGNLIGSTVGLGLAWVIVTWLPGTL